jgi:hypothetical protein
MSISAISSSPPSSISPEKVEQPGAADNDGDSDGTSVQASAQVAPAPQAPVQATPALGTGTLVNKAA